MGHPGPYRIAALLYCLALAVFLTACGGARCETAGEESFQRGYEEGYAAGLREGRTADAVLSGAEEADLSGDSGDTSGFVMVSEAVPDVILEIRYYTTYNFVGERITGYTAPVALLTKEAAEALKAASDDLVQQGYRIKIYDAYRPQSAVDRFAAWAADMDDTRMKAYFYPQLEKSVLFDQGYIASRSGHSRGSTVDLTLVDLATGKEVDMGGSFDYFGELSHSSYTATLTEAQIENRELLRSVMLAHGFRGIDTEWWHFRLADEPYPDTYFDFPVAYLE